MRKTVGRKRPYSSPGGDYVAMCCICGANFYRSQLERKKDGQLYCRDDRDGLIALEEADLLEAQTHILGRRYVQRDGGSGFDFDTIVSNPFIPPNTPSGEDPVS